MARSFWLHEDDQAQIEFLPIECWDYCCAEFAKIEAHDKTHRAPDGIGWTSLYFRSQSPAKISQLSISIDAIKFLMPWRLRRINRVLTGGWSGNGLGIERMMAFQVGGGAILVGWNAVGVVETLWFHGFAASWWDRAALTEAFVRLGLLDPLLLVDWQGDLIDLRDVNAIKNYLGGKPVPPGPAPNEAAEAGKVGLHRFDEPVRPLIVVRKTAGGPSQALLAGADGRCWSVRFDDPGLKSAPAVTPVTFALDQDDDTTECLDLVGDRLLTYHERGGREWLEVHDIRTGDLLFTTPADLAAVLTPDGRYLLICQGEDLAVADLEQPGAPILQTELFAQNSDANEDDASAVKHPPVVFDHAQSAMTMSSTADASTFMLVLGDFGFAVVAELRVDASSDEPVALTSEPRMLYKGLVYDPVDVVGLFPGRWIIVRHGCGCALTRFDLTTGEEADCPPPPSKPDRRYACFGSVVVSGSSPALWVWTDVGPHYWSGDGAPRPLEGNDCEILVMTDESYIGLTPDGFELVRNRF